jgi:hypothetical protein
MLALTLPEPGTRAPTTTALLHLNVRHAPPPAPKVEPLAIDPPQPEAPPGVAPELAIVALPAPGPLPTIAREEAVVEAAEPEDGTISAPNANVALMVPGPTLQPDVALAAVSPALGVESPPAIETAAQETSSRTDARIALLAGPVDMIAPDTPPRLEPEPATVSSPSEMLSMPAPVVALAYPSVPVSTQPPSLDTAGGEPLAMDVASMDESRGIDIAIVEPPIAVAFEPAPATTGLPSIDGEATARVEMDDLDTIAPERPSAPGLVLPAAHPPAPEPEIAPKFAGLPVPVPEDSPPDRSAPVIHLFEAQVAPEAVSPGMVIPESGHLFATESPPVLRPAVTLATYVGPAAAPPPEMEIPVEFAGVMAAARPVATAYVLNAVVAIEPQPEEIPPTVADIMPDDMLIETVATAERTTGNAGAGTASLWLAYARPFEPPAERPLIAVVVLGLGTSRAATNAALKLPGAVTLGFSSFARRLQDWIDLARAAGHEVMLDLPMEPIKYPDIDPGPQALMTSLPEAENLDRLKWHLDRASGYFGVTNNMGSRFTSSAEDLEPVLSTLKLRGLMYLDSRTSRSHVAAKLASTIGLPLAVSDRFIDAEASRAAIDTQLGEIENIARRTGFAVAIGQAFPVTIARLGAWLPTLEEKGLALAPVSAMVAKQAQR